MTAFEDGLWERLVDEHDADRVHLPIARNTPGHRRQALIGGALTAVAVAVAAGVVALTAATTATPAYALTHNADGSIAVTIRDLETAVPALNARFAAMGVAARVVPVEANCSTGGAALNDPMMVYANATATETITIGTKTTEPGYTNVIAAEQLPSGDVAMVMESINSPVPSCFPTTAYILKNTGTTNNDGTPIYQFIPEGVTSPTAPASTTGG